MRISWSHDRELNKLLREAAKSLSTLEDILNEDNDVEYVDLRVPVNVTSWAKRGDRFYSIDRTHGEIPAGVYVVKNDDKGYYFTEAPFITDKLTDFPGTPVRYILDQCKTFWKNKERFTSCGFLHKRGILLYGAAGCGKTSVIKIVVDEIIRQKGIALYVRDVGDTTEGLKILRKIEPNRPVLTILEDIETHMGHPDKLREALAFLDGENQISNVIHLATTNEPEQLEDRVIKRPGRFDLVIGLNPPVREARYAYLKLLLSELVDEEGIKELADMTRGLGFSHLRELVVCTVCLELDRKETLDRLKTGATKKIKVKALGGDDSGLGFTVNFEAK